MNCLQCNFVNRDTAKFCDHCGTLLYASYMAHIRNNSVTQEKEIATIPTKELRDGRFKGQQIFIYLVGMVLLVVALMLFFILVT